MVVLWCAGKAGGVGGSGTITTDAIIPKLRALSKDKNIAGELRRAARRVCWTQTSNACTIASLTADCRFKGIMHVSGHIYIRLGWQWGHM